MKGKNANSGRWLRLAILAGAGLLAFLGALVCDDKDWDNTTDEEDNCPEQFNPVQADEDTDGIGDCCDPETPQHGNLIGYCYRSNFEGFTGVFWDDIETSLTPTGPGRFKVKVRYPDIMGDLIETGPGSHNGRDVWFMSSNTAGLSFFATFVEGSASEVDSKGRVMQLSGLFIFLVCEECDFMQEDDWEFWDHMGAGQAAWTADFMPPEFCGLDQEEEWFGTEGDDDDDDDDNDDDASPDDGDDDDQVADDDAADDDAADDDASPDGDDDSVNVGDDDDDDDDEGACGC